MAKGRLTEVEKFFIENNRDLEVKEIADKLGRTEATVKKHLENNPDEAKVKEEPKQVPKGKADQLMGHHKHKSNNKLTAAVMTKAASEVVDEMRKSGRLKKKDQPHIHKPRGEK